MDVRVQGIRDQSNPEFKKKWPLKTLVGDQSTTELARVHTINTSQKYDFVEVATR